MKRLISCLYIIIPCVADAIVSGDAGVSYTPPVYNLSIGICRHKRTRYNHRNHLPVFCGRA